MEEMNVFDLGTEGVAEGFKEAVNEAFAEPVKEAVKEVCPPVTDMVRESIPVDVLRESMAMPMATEAQFSTLGAMAIGAAGAALVIAGVTVGKKLYDKKKSKKMSLSDEADKAAKDWVKQRTGDYIDGEFEDVEDEFKRTPKEEKSDKASEEKAASKKDNTTTK